VSSPAIEQGRAALRDGDAATAQRAFELALAENESGEALEGLGEVLYLQCDYPAAAAYYERAYAAYRRERQSMAAGRAARTVAWITGNVMGEWAVESGWLARARTILEEAGEDGPERGWVLMIRTFSEPDAQAREALLLEAIAVGRRFGDPDVEFEALSLLGGLFLLTDRVERAWSSSTRRWRPPAPGSCGSSRPLTRSCACSSGRVSWSTTSRAPTSGCARPPT
jgi:tetratricopeptide (TPR) repeat protein